MYTCRHKELAMWRWLTSLRMRLTILLVVAGVAGALIYAGVSRWPVPQVLHWLRTQEAKRKKKGEKA